MPARLWTEKALFKFRRKIYHQLRNQLSAGKTPDMDTAASAAVWEVREEMLKEMEQDDNFKGPLEKEEAWAEILTKIAWFRQLLFDLPLKAQVEIDVSKIPPRAPIAPEPLLRSETAGGGMAEAYVEGIEERIEKEQEHKKENGKEQNDASQ